MKTLNSKNYSIECYDIPHRTLINEKNFIQSLYIADCMLIGEKKHGELFYYYLIIINEYNNKKIEAHFETEFETYKPLIVIEDTEFLSLIGCDGKKIYAYTTESPYNIFHFEKEPEYIGFNNSDFGFEQSSLVQNPFLYKKEDLHKLACLYMYAQEVGGYQYWIIMKYLKGFFAKYNLVEAKITHSEGNYCGRPGCNSYNTILSEVRNQTVIKSLGDISELSYLGCKILKIEKKYQCNEGLTGE